VSSAGPPEAVRKPRESLTSGPDSAEIPCSQRPGPTLTEPVPTGEPAATLDEAKPRPRWGLGAYLLAEAVFLGVSVLLVLPYVWHQPHRTPPPTVLLLSSIVPTVLAASVAVLATVLRGNGPRIDLGLRFDRKDIERGLLFGCAGLVITIPAAALWAWIVGPAKANSAVAVLFAGQRFAPPLAIMVFLVVWLIAPICEEIVYRGLLWGAMERHGATRWWAFGLTTLCFAMAHFELTRTPLLLVIAVPIGLARLFTGRLLASIIAHQLNNLLPSVALLLVLLGELKP
jgi:membrane protease YdiL (CAAX protease family)